TTPDAAPRAAVLALLGLAVALVVLLAAWLLGGPWRLDLRHEPVARPRTASWLRAALYLALAGAWLLIAWTPFLAVLAGLVPPDGGSAGAVVEFLRGRLAGVALRRVLLHSAVVGLFAGLLA